MATASEIITKFELQVNDVTELSTSEELSILNRVYFKVCSEKPWEILKTSATGTVSSDSTGSYITMPSDFAFFVENAQWTDNTMAYQGNASPRVIFIFVNNAYVPYQIINFSDRRQYYNTSGYAYLDYNNSKIRFTMPPTGTTYEFDYIKVPAVLTSSDTPVIPTRFQDILVFGMATQNDVLQLSPKATSYQAENEKMYREYINDMALWNANLQLN
jgi:hypothetical protein